LPLSLKHLGGVYFKLYMKVLACYKHIHWLGVRYRVVVSNLMRSLGYGILGGCGDVIEHVLLLRCKTDKVGRLVLISSYHLHFPGLSEY
jgi:hypothetical protein